jgi:hypothetical protein
MAGMNGNIIYWHLLVLFCPKSHVGSPLNAVDVGRPFPQAMAKEGSHIVVSYYPNGRTPRMEAFINSRF